MPKTQSWPLLYCLFVRIVWKSVRCARDAALEDGTSAGRPVRHFETNETFSRVTVEAFRKLAGRKSSTVHGTSSFAPCSSDRRPLRVAGIFNPYGA
jgi:hypothetical protein